MYDALCQLHNERCDYLEQGADRLGRSPYLLALDEANLSPMEYYWSDFMGACDNEIVVGGDIAEPDNVPPVVIDIGGDPMVVTGTLRFLATINNDHTTTKLSPRLLDRVWIVELSDRTEDAPPDTVSLGPVSMRDLHDRFGARGAGEGEAALQAMLDDVCDACAKLSITVSRRVRQAIEAYCRVGMALFSGEPLDEGAEGAPGTPGRSPLQVAMDYAVLQKLLPRIEGYSSAYGDALRDFADGFLMDDKHRFIHSARRVRAIVEAGKGEMDYYHFFG